MACINYEKDFYTIVFDATWERMMADPVVYRAMCAASNGSTLEKLKEQFKAEYEAQEEISLRAQYQDEGHSSNVAGSLGEESKGTPRT